MKKWAFLGALALTITAPLAAQSAEAPTGQNGWGGAHWGMSVEDVLAAAGPEADAVDLKDDDLWVWGHRQGVQTPTQFLGYSYQLEYHFTPKGDKLSIISINAENEAACDALEGHFKTHLGDGTAKSERFELEPQRFMIVGSRDWDTARNGNRIAFTSITSDPKVVTFCKVLLQDPSVTFKKK